MIPNWKPDTFSPSGHNSPSFRGIFFSGWMLLTRPPHYANKGYWYRWRITILFLFMHNPFSMRCLCVCACVHCVLFPLWISHNTNLTVFLYPPRILSEGLRSPLVAECGIHLLFCLPQSYWVASVCARHSPEHWCWLSASEGISSLLLVKILPGYPTHPSHLPAILDNPLEFRLP